MKKVIVLLLFVLFAVPHLQAQDEFEQKVGDKTYIMKKYYVCFLKRGPNRTHDSLTTAKIQEGHLRHFEKLYEEGIISVVGPFGDEGDARGMIIFNVKSREEAEKYESEDPAVKSGRLVMEIREWWTAKGSTLN